MRWTVSIGEEVNLRVVVAILGHRESLRDLARSILAYSLGPINGRSGHLTKESLARAIFLQSLKVPNFGTYA